MSITPYRIIISTNPDRVASLFIENGSRYLWSMHRPNMTVAIASGEADTRWGARCAAKRAIKNIEHVPGKQRIVSDRMWRP